jgi:hypothetical protein
MDLNSGQLITRSIVHEIPVTNVVIKAVKIWRTNKASRALSSKTETESSTTMPIGLQEWIIITKISKVMMNNNTTTTKTTKLRTNSNNANKLGTT